MRKRRHVEGNFAEVRVQQRGMKAHVLRNRYSVLWSRLAKKRAEHEPVLQREYAWCGEYCSGNNTIVKSLSPQASCMTHLDLMGGVLCLLLYL